MIKVSILGNELDIPCDGEDCVQLKNAIDQIHNKLDLVPNNMRNESRLILTAINLSYELLTLKDESLKFSQDSQQKIDQLIEIIETQLSA
jgi:cell division protein ZapA (FtsZ GTPase activity inhibitor)